MRIWRLALYALLPFPLAAQMSVAMGGGSGRLDQFPVSTISAVSGQFAGTWGPVDIRAIGTNSSHSGLGSISDLNANAHVILRRSGWRLSAGPTARAAKGIGELWTRGIAAEVGLAREVGAFSLSGNWERGIARTGGQQVGWGILQADAGVHLGTVHAEASWVQTLIDDSVARSDVYFDPRSPLSYRDRVRDIRDLGVSLGWQRGDVVLGARLGRRFGDAQPQSWWQISAALDVAPTVTVTANTGRAPADILFGLRGGLTTTFGLRFDMPRHHTAESSGSTARSMVVVRRESEMLVQVRLAVPGAPKSVLISGDVTRWEPVPLHKTTDGRWEGWLAVPRGVYRINVSADEGPWLVPLGLQSVDDGFGGKVGLLVL